jgi:hypothetical protein
MPLKKSEASAKAGPGVLLGGEPGFHSTDALRLQFLTGRRGVAPNLAKIVGDIFFGEASDG